MATKIVANKRNKFNFLFVYRLRRNDLTKGICFSDLFYDLMLNNLMQSGISPNDRIINIATRM